MTEKRFQYKWTGSHTMPIATFIDGEPYQRGTIGLSAVALQMTEAAFVNLAGPFAKMANSKGQIIQTEDGPMLAVEQAAPWARRSHESWLREEGCSLKPIKGRGGMAVSHPKNVVPFSRATTMTRRYLGELRSVSLFSGQIGCELDDWHLLPETDRLLIMSKGRKQNGDEHRYDSGSRYRYGSPAHILRTEAIFCRDGILGAVASAPTFVQIPVRLMAHNALRAKREGCGLTAYGIHKGGGFEQPYAFSFNKADRDEPTKRFKFIDPDWRLLRGYFDGERRAVDRKGRGWEDFRELSRLAKLGDEAAEADLRAEAAFLNKHGGALTYHNLTGTYLRPLLKEAEVDATLHMLRHEHVYDRLREIEAMSIPEREKNRKRGRLAKDMGWSSQAMFRVYDAYEQERIRIEEQVLYNERRAAGLTAAQQLRASPDGRPWVPSTIDGGSPARRRFMALGRAA